jgi:hypothetical protein
MRREQRDDLVAAASGNLLRSQAEQRQESLIAPQHMVRAVEEDEPVETGFECGDKRGGQVGR